MGSPLLHTQWYASLAINISTLNNINMTNNRHMCLPQNNHGDCVVLNTEHFKLYINMVAKPVATLWQPQNPVSNFLY